MGVNAYEKEASSRNGKDYLEFENVRNDGSVANHNTAIGTTTPHQGNSNIGRVVNTNSANGTITNDASNTSTVVNSGSTSCNNITNSGNNNNTVKYYGNCENNINNNARNSSNITTTQSYKTTSNITNTGNNVNNITYNINHNHFETPAVAVPPVRDSHKNTITIKDIDLRQIAYDISIKHHGSENVKQMCHYDSSADDDLASTMTEPYDGIFQ